MKTLGVRTDSVNASNPSDITLKSRFISFLRFIGIGEASKSVTVAPTVTDLTKPSNNTKTVVDFIAATNSTESEGAKENSNASIKIDYDFISQREGGRVTNGYVPDPKKSKSGVTIATGFDLGQRTRNDLENLGLPENLIQKLEPYLGVKKEDAVTLIKDKPLSITDEEAKIIDKKVKAQTTERISKAYDDATPEGTANFKDLPAEAQTVIASVAFQYGVNLATRTPAFWGKVTQQDWKGAVAELRDFRDKYPTRRGLEADLLEKSIK